MKKALVVFAGAMTFVMTFAGAVLAQQTESPPDSVVEGSGGGTAFTGGDASTAAFVAIVLVAVGLVALFVARRRASAQS
ncbi:MAG: LPXTG cell wall anchor domain-containing protein [Actinomycetota bacterium]